MFGHLFDMQTQSDLTAQRLAAGDVAPAVASQRVQEPPPKQVDMAELPLQDAIKQVYGNGKRTLVMFSDPLCPYCQRLEAELPQLADTTVYTFLIPILGPGSRSAAEARWAKDVPARAQDVAVLDRNLQLARRYGVQATPTLVRADGVISAGAMSAAQLDAWMNASAAAPSTAQ
jgi:thiol:disulfide interchange protein DsbC